MTLFDDRNKGFENKYALDEEIAFKINALSNKLLGLWAAEKLGKTGEDAESYARSVIEADLAKPGKDDVIEKITADFTAANIAISANEIKQELQRQATAAKAKLMNG